MAIWSVDIVPGASFSDSVTFIISPTVQPTAPPGTMYADAGDLVSWNNTTQADHLLVQFVSPGTNGKPPMTKPMPPVTTVTPGHQTDAWRAPNNPNSPTPLIFTYCSLKDTNEIVSVIGTIQVS